jgi:hypothetical protein
MVNTISCPALCVFAPLREALPGLYHQSHKGGRGIAARLPEAPRPGWERGWGAGEEPIALDGRGVGERVIGWSGFGVRSWLEVEMSEGNV